MSIRISATSVSSGFDSLSVGGAASLAGSLNVTLGNLGLTSTADSGNSFTILTASSLSGSFSNSNRVVQAISGSTSSPVGQFNINYSNNSATLIYQPLLMLASLSYDTYDTIPQGFGAYKSFKPDSVPKAGFLANEYVSANGAQVVIAFRGTDTSNQVALVKNIAADVSFAGSTPSPLLASEIDDAASFVKSVEQQDPEADITLTGHSLGGAIAQLVGKASGLDTYAFDAPGAQQLYGNLSSSLSVGTWGTPVPGQINTNYRLYGDQASLIGTPIGNTVTINNPNPLPTSVLDIKDILAAHSIANLISQIPANLNNLSISPGTAGQSPEPDFAQPLQKMLTGNPIGSGIYRFIFAVTNGVAALIDPTAGTDFQFVEKPGSPNLASITLPTMDGVAGYEVRYSQNGIWSNYQSVPPNTVDILPSGVSGLEFNALGSLGQGVPLPGFYFQGSFSSSGTVSATLTETAIPSVWASAVRGNWSVSSNWTGGVPNADSSIAVISASTATALKVTLDAPQIIGTLALGSGAPGVGYTLSGSGSNTLAFSNINNNAPSQISVTDGTHYIDALVDLESNLVVTSTSSTPWTLTFDSSSSITDGGNDLSLTLSASNGTLILSGSDTYTGGTFVEAGTLIIDSESALPTATSLVVGGNASSIFAPSAPSLAESPGLAVASVPEPGTFALLGVGVVGLLCYGWRRRK